MSDKAHRELMAEYIKFIQNRVKAIHGPPPPYEDYQIFQIAIEKPYNYFGQRGFIDVLFSEGHFSWGQNCIVEIKPKLDDLGEALRQLNRAEECILKNAINDFHFLNGNYIKVLVCVSSEYNYDIIRKASSILSNVNNLRIEFYCEKTNTFYLIHSSHLSEAFTNKYEDTLFWQYSACKHGLDPHEIYLEFPKYWPNFSEFFYKVE
ncbi:hypothetical protein KKF82_09185 [Patescibacteria group bacterium]|nr:hypothetical protein [Patescibacteria group bacterium]